MSHDDPYAEVEDYAARFSDAGADDQYRLREELLAVSRYIDSKTRQFFWSEAQTRVYFAQFTSPVLSIDNVSAVTSVIIDTGGDAAFLETPTTAYDLARYGNLNAALEGKPYNEIRLRSSAFSANQRVQVIGTFGWLAVPEAVKRATIELTGIFRIESPRATVSIDAMDNVVSMSPQARGFMDKLIETYAGLPVVA